MGGFQILSSKKLTVSRRGRLISLDENNLAGLKNAFPYIKYKKWMMINDRNSRMAHVDTAAHKNYE